MKRDYLLLNIILILALLLVCLINYRLDQKAISECSKYMDVNVCKERLK